MRWLWALNKTLEFNSMEKQLPRMYKALGFIPSPEKEKRERENFKMLSPMPSARNFLKEKKLSLLLLSLLLLSEAGALLGILSSIPSRLLRISILVHYTPVSVSSTFLPQAPTHHHLNKFNSLQFFKMTTKLQTFLNPLPLPSVILPP